MRHHDPDVGRSNALSRGIRQRRNEIIAAIPASRRFARCPECRDDA
jgi:hypothetical protein